MNATIYNISILTGVVMVGVGFGLVAGVGEALAVSGALIILLTLHAAGMLRRTKRAE